MYNLQWRDTSRNYTVVAPDRITANLVYFYMKKDETFFEFRCFSGGVELDPLYGFTKPLEPMAAKIIPERKVHATELKASGDHS